MDKPAGFTLLEVLVALAIISIALLAALRAFDYPRDKLDIKLSDLSFSNGDAAGVLTGSFSSRRGARAAPGKASPATRPPGAGSAASSRSSGGVIDLSANFSRADARSVWRYIPFIPASLRDYLRLALVSGQSRDLQLRLKGDPAHFPFDDPKQGRFEVKAKITDGELRYADDWPRISAIAGDLLIEGRRLSVRAQHGSLLAARLSNVRALIPDLLAKDPQLTVEGQADGSVANFLRFVEMSPVTRYIDGATRDLRASGNARLSLKLDLPLEKLDSTRVAGNVLLQNAQLTFDPELPPLAQMNGRVDFSEGGVAMRGVTAQFMGGPVSLEAQTSDGGIAINAQGTAAVAALRRVVDFAALDHVSGAAPWRGVINARRGVLDLIIESPLQGVAIDLPPPFAKTAAEAMPLRVERSNAADAGTIKRFRGLRVPPKGDVVAISLGNAPGRSVNALMARRSEGKGMVIDRAVVALNEEASVPTAPGIAVNGSLAYVDVDRWQALMAAIPAQAGAVTTGAASGGAAARGSAPSVVSAAVSPVATGTATGALTALNLKIAALDLAGKRINELSLRAQPRGTQWSANVDARELKGEVRWRPEGRGVIQARLSHLIAPGDRPAVPGAAPVPEKATRELPALDIISDNFSLRDKQLGRLELVAVNEVRDWRIEKLILSNPDSTLTVDGAWQSWAARPSTSVNLKLEAHDLGRYLDRMGYPQIMQRGAGRLEGKIAWAGSPQSPDFSTLTGNLSFSAERGQFLKADPGVAKLLGVLSLQSLVTLDLRDLFREGFAYDNIGGTAVVTRGIATTKDFYMKGASAQVRMSGTIDLAHETQNLHLRVVPSLGDGASTITTVILANPVFGIGLTLLQRLLKDPLGQIFAVEYDVTGTWDEPKVTRTHVEAPTEPQTSE